MTDYKALYAEKLISAEELAKQVESGWILGMDTAPSQAPAIMNAIAAESRAAILRACRFRPFLTHIPLSFTPIPTCSEK